MTTRLILPPDIVAQLETRVANGDAKNAIGVIRIALVALDEQDRRKLEVIRAKVARSLADPRPSIPANAVFDGVEQLLRALAKR